MPNQEHERERERETDQTHSYWYIPLAPRVNYSLLVMETAGMMKMASDDDFPLRQGAGTGLQISFLRYRGLRWQNNSSRLNFGGFWIYMIFWRWNHAKMCHRGPTSYQGTATPWLRPGGLWGPCGSSGTPPKLPGFLYFQKKSSKSFVAFGLHLIWIFCKTKNKQKTATGTGH